MTIELVKTDNTQQQIISQLCELYTYEMTDLADFDINDDGYFGYEGLASFWKDENKYAYLIYVNKKLAGFVLIQRGSPIDKADTEIWDVVEFFIMRKYRRQGIGEYVAQNLWASISGPWQVRV
jgi:predicted acetyltransferase